MPNTRLAPTRDDAIPPRRSATRKPSTHVPRTLLLALVVGVVGCGDGGTGVQPGEPASIVIGDGDFTMQEENGQQLLDVTVLDVNDDPVSGSQLVFFSADPNVASVSSEGLITARGNGQTEVSVAVGRFSDMITVTVEIPSEAIDLDVEKEIYGGRASERLFTFEVAESATPQALYVRLQGGSGDVDIRLRQGAPPSQSMIDCESPSEPEFELLNLEFCAVVDPDPGTWHLLVQGFSSFRSILLDVTLVPVQMLEPGIPSIALAGERNDLAILQMAIPPVMPVPGGGIGASATAAAPGTLIVDTEGGTGDADLFATPFDAFSYFTIRFMPCVSGLVGNEESGEVGQPEDALWTIFLLGYEAFDGVVVTADYLGPSGAAAG